MEDQHLKQIKKWLGTGSINIFGMQMSGKDTQGMRLAELLDAAFVAGGHILRQSIIPERAKEAFRTGDLFHPDDYFAIILPYLQKSEFSGRPLVLSSVGRLHGEEQVILEATERAHHPIKAVLHLKISEVTAFARLQHAQRDRDDDHEVNLRRRLVLFKEQTLPVLEVYRSKGLLIEIDGEQPPEQVTAEILARLYKHSQG